MFSDYIEAMYPQDENNDYPFKLCKHISTSYLKEFKSKKIKFLDIGCGRGVHTKNFMKHLNGEFYAVDLEKSEIENVNVSSCNLESQILPYDDNFFDVVFTKSVIEHISNTNNFISEIYRVLKAGGSLVILAPDWQSQMKNFYDDPTHVKPFTIKSMNSSLKMNGFDNVKVSYFRQLPIVWKFPFFEYACDAISIIFPESFKWKNLTDRNTKDRKWVRFSKEKMLLGVCIK